MDIRQLEYVVAIADHGGFTSAARALHVAQPSLSQSIRSLEAELGVELFDRLGRSVQLTSAGEAFVAPARQVLRDVVIARAAIDDVAELRSGHLSLVCLPTLAVHPVAGLIGQFRTLHPGVIVTLAEPESVDGTDVRLRDGSSEIGFSELPVRADLASFEIDRHDYVAVLPPGEEPRGGRVSIQALADLPLITTPPGTSSRRLVDEAFSEAGIDPIIAVETDHREMMVPLVLAGAGAAVLPRPLAADAQQRGAVVKMITPPITRRVGVVWRRGPVSPAARVLLHLAGVADADIDGSRPAPRRRSS